MSLLSRLSFGKRPIYFFHIPKTAGMTMWSLLESRFPREAVFQPHLLDDLLAADPRTLCNYRLFRGHFGVLLPCLLPEPPIQIVTLRDPIDRILSMYGHVWRDAGHWGHAQVHAPDYTVSHFIRDSYFSTLVTNYHARYLAFQPTSAQLQWQPPVGADCKWVKQAIHDLYPLTMPDAELQECALETLRRIDVVGTSEELHAMFHLVAYRMGWKKVPTPGRENSGTLNLKAADLSTEDRDYLREKNSVDYALYNYTRQRMRDDYLRMVDVLIENRPSGLKPPAASV